MNAGQAMLVVNADDLGVSKGATLGIVQAHREGLVTSASLAVTTPFYQHAVDSCVRTCPNLGIGLHFTLTSGRPLSDPARVPLLIDQQGFFLRWRFLPLLAGVSLQNRPGLLDQIDIELEAQFQRLLADGIRPDHIDGERHVHLIPGIFERVVAAARRHNVPFVRAGSELGLHGFRPRHSPWLVWSGGVVKWGVLSTLSRRNRGHVSGDLRSADHVASYLYSGRVDLMLSRFLERRPVPGITEVMVHPGIPEESRGIDVGNRELERYLVSEDRRRELTACLRARDRVGAWTLTNFRQLAWKTTNDRSPRA